MKKTALNILLILFLTAGQFLSAQSSDAEKEEVYAPFVSRLKTEGRGTGIVLSWKDARNLTDPLYHIYESWHPFDSESFPHSSRIATVRGGVEHYLYEPGDSNPRYFLILAEEEGKLFDVFIPYRNMNMKSVSAEKTVLQEQKASRISGLIVVPESQDLLINADTSDPGRPLILFRSTKALINREDLKDAARVRVFEGESIELRDHVVPGIPFYYALVDKALYESGSSIILYDGSVTPSPVSIPWNSGIPKRRTASFLPAAISLCPCSIWSWTLKGENTCPTPAFPVRLSP